MIDLFDDDLRLRVRRLLHGERRSDDLDRLYLALRARSTGCPTVLEIGDFIAHRDQREKGMITQVGRDVLTSVDVWSLSMRNLPIKDCDIIRAAHANLRLATDEQIRTALGWSRQLATGRLKKALAKFEKGDSLSESEYAALAYFGNRFIWRPAFSASDLVSELGTLLERTGLMSGDDLDRLKAASGFITLHALCAMHGSSITLTDGRTARLFVGYANQDGWLEVKVDLRFHELGKPLMTPICLFLTDLKARDFCVDELLEIAPMLANHWAMPLEIDPDGRLAPLR